MPENRLPPPNEVVTQIEEIAPPPATPAAHYRLGALPRSLADATRSAADYQYGKLINTRDSATLARSSFEYCIFPASWTRNGGALWATSPREYRHDMNMMT